MTPRNEIQMWSKKKLGVRGHLHNILFSKFSWRAFEIKVTKQIFFFYLYVNITIQKLNFYTLKKLIK